MWCHRANQSTRRTDADHQKLKAQKLGPASFDSCIVPMAMKEEVLRQLVDELLSSADESTRVCHGVSRDDLDLNKQLIELVVNAGLMVLTQRPVTGNAPI